MDLSAEEKKSLYIFLRENDSSLDKTMYSLKYRLEKELFSIMTIEEIQRIGKKKSE